MTVSTQSKNLSPPLSLGMAALSGLLYAGAYPNLDWGWLAWIGLIPFLVTFPHCSKRSALAHAAVFSLCYVGGVTLWVAQFAQPIIGTALSLVGWVLVASYQAFYFAVWALGADWLARRPSRWAWRLGLPALWAICEWWRQIGTLGFGWGELAYTQHLALPILQITKLTGPMGLAFLIILVNVALAEVLASPRTGRRGAIFPLAAAGLVILALVYGEITLHTENLHPTFIAAALQGNIDQNVQQTPAYVQKTLQTFSQMGRQAAEQGAALTVWPETACPGYPRSDPADQITLSADALQSHQTIVVGGVEYDWKTQKNANALFLVTPRGQITGSYQKRELVPFGEFVPGRKWMPFLEALHVTNSDMQPGADTQPLLDAGPEMGKLGTVICFESSYSRLTREQVARGANLLVVSTDDTWFGRTSATRQHSALAAVRAAETDRYLIRSAATGISEIIDPTGKVLAEAGPFHPAIVSAPVQSRATLTPYVRWGDWFIVFCGLLLLGVANARDRRAGIFRNSGR